MKDEITLLEAQEKALDKLIAKKQKIKDINKEVAEMSLVTGHKTSTSDIEEVQKRLDNKISDFTAKTEDTLDDVSNGKTDKIDALKPDCAIVPGIAFDVHGNRLGFGAGYYDRYFETAGEITKIALAYDFQILNEIPREDNDISMDAIITEKRIIVL